MNAVMQFLRRMYGVFAVIVLAIGKAMQSIARGTLILVTFGFTTLTNFWERHHDQVGKFLEDFLIVFLVHMTFFVLEHGIA